jgi:hypothetical protein
LVSSNAKVVEYVNGIKNQRIKFKGYVDLKLNFHLLKECKLKSIPNATKEIKEDDNTTSLYFSGVKEAEITIVCK